MTLPVPTDLLKSLEAPVKPFHPKTREWVLRHQDHFPWMIGLGSFLLFLGLVYLQPDHRPDHWSEFLGDVFLMGICGCLAGLMFSQYFAMRSLRLLSAGLNHRWLTRKTVCHAYLNAPIEGVEEALQNHAHGIYFLSVPFLRQALEDWLLQSPIIGTYELARLEDTLWRYALTHYSKTSYQAQLDATYNPADESFDHFWRDFKVHLDQRLLQKATPQSSPPQQVVPRRL